jgi:type I restriction enzyme S subunit
VAYILLSCTAELNHRGNGTTFLELSTHALRAFRIASPPLEEQKLIAYFLDRETGKIDTLVAKQQQLISLLKEKRQSLISHTVTKGLNPNVRMKDSGVEWIGEIPEHWEVKRVGKSCVVSPKRNKNLLSNLEQLVSFLPMTSFSNDGTADFSNEVVLESVINGYTYMEFGDIAISKVTPCFENGKGARLSDMPTKVGFATTEITVIRPLRMVGDYVFYLFRIPEVIDLGVSWMYGVGGLQRIPDRFFELLEAPFPLIDEQKQIAAYLDAETSKIDQLIDKANQSIALLKERRSSLVSAAVTGKIDVREAT